MNFLTFLSLESMFELVIKCTIISYDIYTTYK